MSACTIIQSASHRLQTIRDPFVTFCYSAYPSHSLLKLKRISQPTSPFTTSLNVQYPRDMNRERGVSTRRRTGLRQPLSVSKTPLPRPVLDPARRSKYEVSDDHGLWGFFYSKSKALNTPEEDYEFGRSWTVEELRGKSWEDLHALWWVCAKENNRIATASYERRRIKAGYGDAESEERDKTVRKTQRAIKQVLTERWYSWTEARTLAENDPEIDLSGSGPAYRPKDLFEENSSNGSDTNIEAEKKVIQNEPKTSI